MKSIEVVAATRLGKDEFWSRSALGRSLQRMRHLPIVANIFHANTEGLPTRYNAAIDAADCEDHVLFVHDDVFIEDFHLTTRLADAFAVFDVVGVAGNRRLAPNHVGWQFKDSIHELDDRQHLSGGVAHGTNPFAPIDSWGPSPAPCELLDGLFLAVNRKRLIDTHTRFDPRFRFHFYDLDFCRTARQHGLRVGTWPISVTHQSSGVFGSESWQQANALYQGKWAAQ